MGPADDFLLVRQVPLLDDRVLQWVRPMPAGATADDKPVRARPAVSVVVFRPDCDAR